MTLVIVPATFSLAVGFEDWLAPKIGRRLMTGGKNAARRCRRRPNNRSQG